MRVMKTITSRFSAFMLLLCVLLLVSSRELIAQDKKAFDPVQVRAGFEAASSEYFDYIKSELTGLESEKSNNRYWLAHIKPRKAGHYAVRYTFKYNDPFYSEGDFKINVRVGGKGCDRQSRGSGISRFCLGDTVIPPIHAANRYDYAFSIRYTPDGDPEIEKRPTPGTLPDPPEVDNPLSANIKYLGTTRSEMLHRNGGSTITYSAVFEAVAPGKFNLVLSSKHDDSPPIKPYKGAGTPLLIAGRNESITALASHEDIINYADDGKFKSTSGGTFSTDLLVLRPGDIFSLPYASSVTYGPGNKPLLNNPLLKNNDAGLRAVPIPDIQRVKFYIDPKASYNQFIAEFFNTK